jgi:FHS family glucose/mannose:H+ symporter-like MFS transporter
MRKLIWMGCLAYLLIGLAHVVVGSLLTVMLDHYGRAYSDGGQLIFAQFAGFLIGVLSTPWWSQKYSRRGALLLAFGCLFAAETVFSFLPPWSWIVMFAPLAGFGFGMIEAVIGSLVIDAAKDNKAVAFSRLEVFFGVGALLMPILSSLFIVIGWWRASFVSVALFSLVLAAVWARMSFGTDIDGELMKQKPKGADEQGFGLGYGKKQAAIMSLFSFLFLIYVGIEMSLVNFLPAIFIENLKVSDAMATLSVTFFWSTMVVGRVFAGVIAERISYPRYLIYGSVGTLLFLAGFSAVMNVWGAFALVLLLGLFMSGMFAILLIYANSLLPGMTEKTTSLLIAAGGIGGALLPLFTGWSLDRFTVSGTLWILVGFSLLMFLLVMISSRMRVVQGG